MSKCLLCDKENYLEIKFVNGSKKKKYIYLCKDCWRKFFFRSKKRKGKSDKKCPLCGYTVKDFNEYRFLGCSFCYEYFYEEVVDYLKKIHTDIIYKGKFPQRFKKYEKKLREIFGMRNYLIDEIKINGKYK